MTEQELSKFYNLKQEINDLQKRIDELESTGGISGMQYKEVDVMATASNKSIQEKIMILKERFIERRITAMEEYLKIERYIEGIEDLVIRQIMKYRFMDLKQWKQIDMIMHYAEGTSKKKYYRYKKQNCPLLSP